MTKRTFDEWMDRVDDSVERLAGCSSADLPDCSYRDWYEDGINPAQAAEMALEDAGFDC